MAHLLGLFFILTLIVSWLWLIKLIYERSYILKCISSFQKDIDRLKLKRCNHC
jgi:hypothetical protein